MYAMEMRHSGEIREAQIFVAVLGCSNYTYAEASWTQSLPDWLGAHVRALEFFGGAPAAFVPDNLKSGVDKPILARLRDRQFFSLPELNAAIEVLRIELNEQPFQKVDGSRRSRFLELDRPVLQALPPRAYEYAQWKCAKVHPDYHIEVEHAYTPPHTCTSVNASRYASALA